MTVYNFGSINIDHVYRVSHFVQPGETLASHSLETVLGGKGANQSVALARAGAAVTHLGRISQSDVWAKEALETFGVDVSGIQLMKSASGHAIIQVDDNGENAIVLHGGANQSFDENALRKLLSGAKPGDWLLIQNECNALADVLAVAQQHEMKIAFNPAPMDSAVANLPLAQCDLLILNEVEALQLAYTDSAPANSAFNSDQDDDPLYAQLRDRYPDCLIVLTLGGKGALLLHHDGITRMNAPEVSVVDSTGAGDTFVGYFLCGLIDKMSPEAALQRACAAGALAVTVAGATPGIPSRSDVDELVSKLSLG